MESAARLDSDLITKNLLLCIQSSKTDKSRLRKTRLIRLALRTKCDQSPSFTHLSLYSLDFEKETESAGSTIVMLPFLLVFVAAVAGFLYVFRKLNLHHTLLNKVNILLT